MGQRENDRGVVHPLALGVTSGLLGGALGGFVYALWGSARPFNVGVFVLQAGLVVPLSSVSGLLFGVWNAFVRGGSARENELSGPDAPIRRALTLAIALIVLGPAAAATMSLSGVGLGVQSLMLGVCVAASLVLSRSIAGIAHQLVTRRSSLLGAQAATRVELLAWMLVLGLFALLVLAGSRSGVGHPWALYGVFLRPELDLRWPALFGLSATVVYVMALWCGTSRSVWLFRTALLVGPLGLALGSGAYVASAASALEVERVRGPSADLLSLVQRVWDADRDGAARAFGGGDCNDHDAAVFSGAFDVAGNGKDEDCDGRDLEPLVAQAPSVSLPKRIEAGRPSQKFNVLLLTVDTMRFDFGATVEVPRARIAPHLTRLSERSLVFERAYSLASYTSKSLGPALIGRYPSETERTFEHFDRFSKNNLFLAELAQKSGIRTASVQGYWYFFFKGYGFERGFDYIDSSAAPRNVAIEGDNTSNAHAVAEAAIRTLESQRESKHQFFTWVHWVDPHAAYVRHSEHDFGTGERERYQSEIAAVDAEIGKIVARLTEFGLAESTAIVVTSDHGEAFSEHGMIRHGFELWEELVRVPLIVHVPGLTPGRVQARRSAIDLVPTIVALLGIEPPSAPHELRGVSLLRDAEPGQPQERPIVVDMPEGPHNQERRAFYSGASKLITSRGRVLGVYNLDTDPAERSNQKDDDALVQRLRREEQEVWRGLKPIRVK